MILNGINSIRIDINSARHVVVSTRKKVMPVVELASSTETNKKKQNTKPFKNNLDSNQNHLNATSTLLSTDGKYYRANLLNEIVDKMSGIEPRYYPGHLVEYYA